MSYARRVAYNTIAQIVGRLLTTVISLATVSILNSALKPAGWGAYVAVTTYLGFFSVLADMGLNLLYLREISKQPDQVDEITSRFLGFRLFTAFLVLLVLAPAIGLLVPVYHAYVLPILLLSVGQFILTLNQMCVTVVQARLLMDRAMIGDLVGRVVIMLVTVFAVAHAPEASRLLTAVGAVVLGNVINLLIMLYFVRGMVKFRPRFVLREWPRIFIEVLPMGAMAVLGMIHFKADSVILTLYRPAVDVGIYGNAYKFLEIIITLPAMFVGGLFPEMNQMIQRGRDELTVLMQKAFDLLLFAVVPIVVGLILIAPQLIAIVTRNYIGESAHSLQILSLAMFPLFLGTLMAHALLAAEKQKQLSLVELLAVAANIGLNLYLIPRFTYYGAGWATVTTEGLTTVLTTWLAWRAIGFLPRLRTLWPAAVGALIMYACSRLLHYLPSWGGTYYQWSRGYQAAMLIAVMVVGVVAYLLPFILLKRFPPVIQERLHGRRQ